MFDPQIIFHDFCFKKMNGQMGNSWTVCAALARVCRPTARRGLWMVEVFAPGARASRSVMFSLTVKQASLSCTSVTHACTLHHCRRAHARAHARARTALSVVAAGVHEIRVKHPPDKVFPFFFLEKFKIDQRLRKTDNLT